MDLLKLNSEICSMRPFARQSTVHVIHHLTKTAGKLRKKYGPEDKTAAYRKKAERCEQEALIVKVLAPDEIIKFSLQFDSSLRDKVLNDISIPLPAKAFARIAAHQSMVKAVNGFRDKYPDWNKWLEKNLEKLGTGSRFGTKMKNGRVKAHMQQRQRVQEAIDTIRRAQMSWLHNSEKNKIKVNLEESKEGTVEKRSEVKNRNNDDQKCSASTTTKINKSKLQSNAEAGSVCFDNSDAEASDDSSAKPCVKGERNVNEEADKAISNRNQNSRLILYEEVNENESESEEDTRERKRKIVTDKKLENKESVELKREDSDSEDDAESDDSLSANPDNECENLKENESQGSADDESEIHNEINEKTAKKLLKKEKRKQKILLPRSREVEVCKFSDLLKKEHTKKIDEENESDDPVDEDKPFKSLEKGIDPFFMTRNNDFLRIATANREANPKEPIRKGPKWGIEGSEDWTGTRSERRARARRMMGIPDPEGFSRRRGPPKFDSPSFPKQREALSAYPAKKGPSDKPENLHPSWAAKRKMNISSVGFQGKKVKFDDSD